MKTITVRDMMLPLKDYATVSREATLREAVLASEIIQPPSESEYIDENASLGEATYQLIIYPYHSLLATGGGEVVGNLRLSDVFVKVCDIITNDSCYGR
jgi:hypothetical protein